MNKNLEELIDYKNGKYDYLPSKMYHLFNDIIEVLEGFEKRLEELEKYKKNILEYHEINQSGGINNIKIVLDDPNQK